MNRPNRARILTLAALAAFASIAPGLIGSREISVKRETAHEFFARKTAERIVSRGGSALAYYGHKTNGGQRRKNAIRARRLRNNGERSRFVSKHS